MVNNKKEKEILKKIICQNLELLFDKLEQLNRQEQELELDNKECFGIKK